MSDLTGDTPYAVTTRENGEYRRPHSLTPIPAHLGADADHLATEFMTHDGSPGHGRPGLEVGAAYPAAADPQKKFTRSRRRVLNPFNAHRPTSSDYCRPHESSCDPALISVRTSYPIQTDRGPVEHGVLDDGQRQLGVLVGSSWTSWKGGVAE